MSFNKFLNISILILLFTPFIKSCEEKAAPTEEATVTEKCAATEEPAHEIDIFDTIEYNEQFDTLINNSEDNSKSNNNLVTTIESDTIDPSDEPNIFMKALIIAAYPEGIFTSVSGFGLIMESTDDLFHLKFRYDWYFGHLILISLILHLIDLKKRGFNWIHSHKLYLVAQLLIQS